MVPDVFVGERTAPLNVVNLHGNISADGHTTVHGVVRIDDGSTTSLLTAVQGSAQSTCAEPDGNGVGGLTGFEVTLRDVRSDERSFLSIETLPGTTIDASGIYRVIISIDGERIEAEMHARSLGR